MQTLSGFRDMQINPITKFAKAYPEFVTTPLELELVTNLFTYESSGYQRLYENEMLKKTSMLDQECATIEGRLDGLLHDDRVRATNATRPVKSPSTPEIEQDSTGQPEMWPHTVDADSVDRIVSKLGDRLSGPHCVDAWTGSWTALRRKHNVDADSVERNASKCKTWHSAAASFLNAYGTVDAAVAAFIEHDGVLPELTDLPPASHQASRDDNRFSERVARAHQLGRKEQFKLVRRWAELNLERRRGRMALAGRWSEM